MIIYHIKGAKKNENKKQKKLFKTKWYYSNALTDPKILSMRCDYGLERLWFILGNIRNVKK